ncbi:DUF2278 family protein [Aerosakkonemataceae cyanobacterium BLCC-F50]|uniref:DUF2278 family protein n=1 Tax=Floridaenema flaviceps BLCC-F50 TaxID=3153642 RepID=A0ABV4Y2W1_9CYAN
MPLKEYGVLKGRPIARRLAVTSNAHYQVHLVDDNTDYRIAINANSKLSPSELEYLMDENFVHPITSNLVNLPLGFKRLESKPGGLALDFIRGNLFDRRKMIPLPFNVPGPDNDLNEKIDKYIQRAMSDEDALIYAFGERWGPERNIKDKIFGFLPGNGIHDIHMNQGNDKKFERDDGVWQDGALLIHFPSENRWIGIFLKFQSQCWHTDDKTGHCITAKPEPSDPTQTPIEGEPDLVIRIIAALVNPEGADPGKETVTLLNTSPASIDLTGWAIADRLKNKHPLSGTLEKGSTLVVKLPETVQLGNKGGIITLLDNRGIKIHGVSYTEKQADREGWSIVF